MHGISRSSVSRCTESVTKSICKTVKNINFPIDLFVLKSCLKKHDDYLKTYEYIKNAYCWQMAVLHSVVQPITDCIWTFWQAVFLVRWWLFGMFSIIFKIQILDLLIQVTLNGTWKPIPILTIQKLMVMILLFCPLTINLFLRTTCPSASTSKIVFVSPWNKMNM